MARANDPDIIIADEPTTALDVTVQAQILDLLRQLAQERGIGMVFQEQSLITNLTVMENIFLGYEQQFVKFGVIDWKAMAAAARAQLAKVKLDIDPSTITSNLSFAQRQLVELAKVLTTW